MNSLKITKTDTHFEATLPVAGYHKLPVRFLIISLLLLIYGFIATILSFNESLGLHQTLIPYLMIGFTLISSGFLFFSLILMFSETTVSLNHQEFTLSRSFWGIQKTYITDIDNISPICLEEVTFKILLSTIKLIIIYDIGHKHYLGAWLNEADLNLLYQEMLKFLSQTQHETIQYGSN